MIHLNVYVYEIGGQGDFIYMNIQLLWHYLKAFVLPHWIAFFIKNNFQLSILFH